MTRRLSEPTIAFSDEIQTYQQEFLQQSGSIDGCCNFL